MQVKKFLDHSHSIKKVKTPILLKYGKPIVPKKKSTASTTSNVNNDTNKLNELIEAKLNQFKNDLNSTLLNKTNDLQASFETQLINLYQTITDKIEQIQVHHNVTEITEDDDTQYLNKNFDEFDPFIDENPNAELLTSNKKIEPNKVYKKIINGNIDYFEFVQ